MNFIDARERYFRDSHFKSLVDMLVSHAMSLDMSPGEIREAAVFAEIKFQMLQPAKQLFPRKAEEIEIEIMRRSKEHGKLD